MLGVVRVYSRKSNIFLSDVTTIFHMLSKQQHPTTTLRRGASLSSRKRSRLEYEQQQQKHYAGQENISLDGTRGLADFEAITLAGGQAVTKSKRFQQTIYDFQESNHDLFMSTMQNIFLSSQSQSHHSDSQSLSFSRGNANPFFAREEDITMKPDISSGSNHNDDGCNHDHELELLPFISLSHSQQSEHQSPDSVRKRLLFDDEQEQSPLFLASNLRLPFHPSSSRQPRQQHDRQDTDAVQPDAPHVAAPVRAIDQQRQQQEEPDDRAVVFVQDRQTQDVNIPDVAAGNLKQIFMPVNMQPLQLPTMPTSGRRSVQQQHDDDHALAASVHVSADISVAAANRTGSSSTGSQKRSILQREPTSQQQQQQGYPRSATTTGRRAERRSDEDNDEDGDEDGDEADGKTRKKQKRRKHTQMIFDTVTELTNVQLRNQLDDTSEIVYGEDEDRMFVRRMKKIGALQPPRKGKKGQRRLHPVLTGQQIPGFLSSFHQDIQRTWAANFNARDHDDRYRNEDSEQQRSNEEQQQQQESVQRDGAGFQSGGQNVSQHENEQTPEQMRDVMKNDNNNIPTSITGQGDTNRRMMMAEQDMDIVMAPDIAMPPPMEVDHPAAGDGVAITGGEGEAGNAAGDVDVLRGDGIENVMLDGGVGSGSIGAAEASDMGGNSRSLSGSFLSSDRDGRTTDNPRDRLFDMVSYFF